MKKIILYHTVTDSLYEICDFNRVARIGKKLFDQLGRLPPLELCQIIYRRKTPRQICKIIIADLRRIGRL